MQYKIIVDKQPRTNPSVDKKEYIIDIEELRRKGDVYDSINITLDKNYVTRRLTLSEYGVLSELDEEVIENLNEVNVELFEGDNYIYLFDMIGNIFHAEYIVKNDFTDNMVTTSKMNSAINQSAQNIEISVNQKLENYSTTEEMQSAIDLSSGTIMIEVNKKVNDEDLTGANITLRINKDTSEATINADKISLAGKEIDLTSDNIIISSTNFNVDKNGNLTCSNANITGGIIKVGSKNAQLQIVDSNNSLLMALNSTGQHFYNNGTIFADMGVKTVNSNRYIAFSVPVDYGNDIQDGMAWGIQTTSDNKFWPILYVKNFHMANKNAGDFSGELVLTACNLNLEGINSAITCGSVKIGTASILGGVAFSDIETSQNLLTIMPQTDLSYGEVNILDKISFYRNQAGSNSFRIGSGSNYCLLADDGSIYAKTIGSVDAVMSCKTLNSYGHIYCNNGVEPFSTEDKKKDIEKYENRALNEIMNTDIYYYNYKDDEEGTKRRVGAIIGADYKCSEEIIGTERKGIDLYSMISVAYKAIQELVEKIEQLEVRE